MVLLVACGTFGALIFFLTRRSGIVWDPPGSRRQTSVPVSFPKTEAGTVLDRRQFDVALDLLIVGFYRPSKARGRVSDYRIIESVVQLRGRGLLQKLHGTYCLY